MENQVLKTILDNNPDMTLDQIAKLYSFDKQRIVDYQLKLVSNYKFSRIARERDYNRAIEDKIRAEQLMKSILIEGM